MKTTPLFLLLSAFVLVSLKRLFLNVSLIEVVPRPALKSGAGILIVSRNRHERGYWFYLKKGFCVALTANQDNHFFTWGTITSATTAVLASRLTNRDILHALKGAPPLRDRG